MSYSWIGFLGTLMDRCNGNNSEMSPFLFGISISQNKDTDWFKTTISDCDRD